MIRNALIICGVILLVVLSIYTSGSSEPRADLAYVNPSGIHTLDPARMSWTQDFRVALNLWEGLTVWDPETLEPVSDGEIGEMVVTTLCKEAAPLIRYRTRQGQPYLPF